VALIIGGTLAYLFLPFPWWLVVVGGLVAFEGLEIWFWLWMKRQRPRSGHEAMVGARGVLARPGRVRIRGTTYPARERDDLQPGDPVEVEALDGMTLIVRRASPYEPEG
jgi:membrane protein implicated in regulation of membrane protease activity